MKTTMQYYQVAGLLFGIEASDEQLAQLPNYAPFICGTNDSSSHPLFVIRVHNEAMPSVEGYEHVFTDKSDEDMPRIEMYKSPDEWLFRVSMYRESQVVSVMRCASDWSVVDLYMDPIHTRFAIDNAAMLVFAFASIKLNTLLFHSSVTMLNGYGYMFLGHSGTGKSTHSRQWLEAFPEAELLNDDNPVLRILPDKSVRVYGSPWSGKTPCYKNMEVEVAALVQLAQAPENKMFPLRMTQAYPYILASVSGLKVLPEMMDTLYESIARLLELKPVYKLECLPNTDAAKLCRNTINSLL